MEGSPTAVVDTHRVPGTAGAVVFAVALALYAGTFEILDDGTILGNDAIPYARELAGGTPEGLWNAHHLLFHPLVALIARAWAAATGSAIGIQTVLGAQMAVSAVGGAVCVLLLFRFATRLLGPLRGGLLATAFALTSAQWLYSAVGETYVPANAAVLGSLIVAVELRLGLREADLRAKAALVGWLALAVLLRQDSVLVVPALLLLLRLWDWVTTSLAAGWITIALFALAWWSSGVDAGFVSWARGIQESGLWGNWTDFSAVLIVTAVVVQAVVYVALSNPFVGLGTVALGLGTLVPTRPLTRTLVRVGGALIGFAVLRVFFYAWWQPGNIEFHAGTVLPLFLAAAVLLPPADRNGRPLHHQTVLLGLFTVLVAWGTWSKLIGPFRDDLIHRRAALALELVGADGVVVSLDRFQHYALWREDSATAETVDASDLMPYRLDAVPAEVMTELGELWGRVGSARRADRTVIIMRDTVLPPRLDHEDWPIAPIGHVLTAEVGRAVEELRVPEDIGHWGWVLPPE